MTKRKSLIAVFSFALALSLALLCGITLSGSGLTVYAADEKTIIPLVEAAVTAPVAGDTISTTATVSGAFYKLNKVEWYRGTETEPENKMNPLARFVEGQQYTVTVKFAISNLSYCFNSESTLAKINGQSATVVSATAAFITAKYTFTVESTPIPEHNVTLESGTLDDGSTSGRFKEGAKVTITADAAPEGKVFSEWVVVSGDADIYYTSSKKATFEMGSGDVVIKAVYKTVIQVVELTLKTPIAGDAADNNNVLSYPTDKGYTATLTWKKDWSDLPDGAIFVLGTEYLAIIEVRVSGDGVFTNDTVAYLNGIEEYKFDVCPGSFEVREFFTASEKAPVYFDVKVTGGRAETDERLIIKSEKDREITLTADVEDGKIFDKWVVVSGNVTLKDANSTTTTFVMPDGAVEIKATYKSNMPSDGEDTTGDGGEANSGTEDPGTEDPGMDHPGGEEKLSEPTENKGLPGGAVAGIVIGSVAVAGIGGFAVVWFVVRKKSFVG